MGVRVLPQLKKRSPQSFMAGLQAAASNSSLRPSWTTNENGETVNELQLLDDYDKLSSTALLTVYCGTLLSFNSR